MLRSTKGRTHSNLVVRVDQAFYADAKQSALEIRTSFFSFLFFFFLHTNCSQW